VKRPSQRMRMEAHNIEYCTAVKDSDWCPIHNAATEVADNGDTILSKYLAEFKSDKSMECGHHILDTMEYLKSFGMISYYKHKIHNTDCCHGETLQKQEILDYLNGLGEFTGFLHTDCKPNGNIRYHGNLIKGWHDWVKVRYFNDEWMCQILIFLEVTEIDQSNNTLQTGKYVLLHFVNQNVFADKPTHPLYGGKYHNLQ